MGEESGGSFWRWAAGRGRWGRGETRKMLLLSGWGRGREGGKGEGKAPFLLFFAWPLTHNGDGGSRWKGEEEGGESISPFRLPQFLQTTTQDREKESENWPTLKESRKVGREAPFACEKRREKCLVFEPCFSFPAVRAWPDKQASADSAGLLPK